MNVKIEIIPHEQQAYPTVGNWFYDKDGNVTIQVSQMSDWRYEMLVAFHELREVLHCKQSGVAQQAVDNFDIGYEAARHLINPEDRSEPGDAPQAPYHHQHVAATKAEKELAADLGVDWQAYEAEIESLP